MTHLKARRIVFISSMELSKVCLLILPHDSFTRIQSCTQYTQFSFLNLIIRHLDIVLHCNFFVYRLWHVICRWIICCSYETASILCKSSFVRVHVRCQDFFPMREFKKLPSNFSRICTKWLLLKFSTTIRLNLTPRVTFLITSWENKIEKLNWTFFNSHSV